MNTQRKFVQATLGAAVAMTVTVAGMSPATAAEAAAVSTSTTADVATGAGLVTATATAKAFRAARQNGAANLTIAYACVATAVGAVRTHVPACTITTDLGGSYSDPSDVTPGEIAQSSGVITLPGNSARICMTAAGRMALDQSLVQATACAPINLAA